MIYLVSAAQTANEAKNYPQLLGRNNPQSLSECGKRQAAALGAQFGALDISAIYTSAQSAAVQTARAIRGTSGRPLTFCTSLVEADFGNWEGMTREQTVRTNYHPKFMAGAGFPAGETFKQISKRAFGYIEQLAKTHAHKHIVVISHEWVLRTVLCQLCGVSFDRIREIDQDPARVSLVRIFRGRLELKAMNNDFAFMEGDMEIPCDTFSTTKSH
jgi:probable phosphoglycerate mutase